MHVLGGDLRMLHCCSFPCRRDSYVEQRACLHACRVACVLACRCHCPCGTAGEALDAAFVADACQVDGDDDYGSHRRLLLYCTLSLAGTAMVA